MCMAILKLNIELVSLVSHSDSRTVAFLRGDPDLDAGIEFDKIQDGPIGKRLRHKMHLWISWHPDVKGKYHRFKSGAARHRDCFTFIDLATLVRLYGFTCHPSKVNPSFELVVLTTHAIKKENHTDTAELDRVIAWNNNMATKKALKAAYPEREGA
jgi:hypothetical protein